MEKKSPAAFAYLEKNARCALTGQGSQTENVLEPSALEQADAPTFDWGPALNALRAGKKPVYAVQPVQGDLFTYWETLPEGQLELIVSNPPYLTAAEMERLQPEVAQEPAMALEAGEDGLVFYRALAQHYQNALCPGGAAGVGDRLAAAGSCKRPAGRERMGRYPLHPGLWRQRPLCDRSSRKINWKKQTTSCCNILILCYTKKESEGQPALCGPKG